MLTLDDGGHIHANLVICADGRNSGSAKRAGVTYTGWKYAQSALVCALEHEHLHNGFAYQHFMPPGPLAILPLKDNRCSIVWTETTENARTIMAMDNDAYLDVLRPRFGNFLGEIKLVGERFFYPLDMSIAKSFIAERVAVIGDAAHGMHPIAGQGLNAGMRDIAALAQLCQEARQRGEDFGSQAVLARYQEWRRFDATALALTMDAFNRLFSNDNSFLRGLRTLGMGVVNRLPSTKRTFMREAAGVTGNLPDLMR
jgi:2-octaprenyl-6-methoxyphenol hydroxylase